MRWRGATWCSTCSPSRAWRPSRKSTPPLRPLGVTRQGSMADSSYPAFLDLVKRQLRQDYRDEDLTEEGVAHLHQLRSDPAGEGRDLRQRNAQASQWAQGGRPGRGGDGRDQSGNR
ncbi:hypothetical protein ACPA9J_20860 [Pseudomonas aeruginosa]